MRHRPVHPDSQRPSASTLVRDRARPSAAPSFAVRRTRPPPPSALVADCLGFLREHAEHEDRHVLPELARLAPGAGRGPGRRRTPSWSGPRSRSTACGRALAPLPATAADERQALGGELARRFHGVVVAMQLRHMDREERDAQRRSSGRTSTTATSAR